jgi:NTF2 fold immunity protein of polymorphic toxin system component
MRQRCAIAMVLMFVTMLATAKETRKVQRDYVPDQKTAERIAEAVLVAQYGQDRVNAQLPLRATSTSKDSWLVQGTIHESNQLGGNFGVWINKHSGCLQVIERMK